MWILLIGVTLVFAKLPPDAQGVLDQFQNRVLSLDEVVRRAIQSSDSYRAIESQAIAVDSPRLLAGAATDVIMTSQASWLEDKREASNPFLPTGITGQQYSLGVSSLFSTGTRVGFELTHQLNKFTVSTAGLTSTAETRGLLTLSQSLWKDFFGRATRKGLEAGERLTEVSRFALSDAQEKWFSKISQLFYESWLAQAQKEAAEANLQRRTRLLQAVQIRIRRGTSEDPDLLQVKSAVKLSEIQVAESHEALADRWRLLIATLKLPKEWGVTVNPSDIPMALDSHFEENLKVCGSEAAMSSPPTESLSVQQLKAHREAALSQMERAESENHPDLRLSLGVGNNNIEPQSGETFGDFTSFKHPYYAVGLSLSVPLGFRAEEARVHQATADFLRADADWASGTDLLVTEWKNACMELFRLHRARALLGEATQWQLERVRAEEARFKLGRVQTTQVIQAGDDASQASISLKQTEAKLRIAGWEVSRLKGSLLGYLDGLKTKRE